MFLCQSDLFSVLFKHALSVMLTLGMRFKPSNLLKIIDIKLTFRTLSFSLHSVHQCGFFKRSKYDDSIPKYHAVRIRKETRHFTEESIMFDPFEKKQWMTVWNENESYSWDFCLANVRDYRTFWSPLNIMESEFRTLHSLCCYSKEPQDFFHTLVCNTAMVWSLKIPTEW